MDKGGGPGGLGLWTNVDGLGYRARAPPSLLGRVVAGGLWIDAG